LEREEKYSIQKKKKVAPGKQRRWKTRYNTVEKSKKKKKDLAREVMEIKTLF